ncbi:hypothetical protein J4465_01350 [Candidatus Pacearchaeota archaeon]|nr:hypothetical protein [Candidatus Pacearchaeota archaeon]
MTDSKSITKTHKGKVKAVWKYKTRLYVVTSTKLYTEVLEKFRKYYQTEDVKQVMVEDFFKDLMEYNTSLLVSIRDGEIFHDSLGIVKVVKINIEKGLMVGTKEILLKKLLAIQEYLREIERVKINVFDNIYTSVIEASQAALILKGQIVVIPREIPKALKKDVFGRGLDKIYIGYAEEIIMLYKAFEHKKINIPDGRKLDDLNQKAIAFKEAIERMKS